MFIDLIAGAIAVVVNVAVLWICFVRGLHHSLAVSIVVTGGVTAILFTVHPALAALPPWAMLVVWCMLAIGLYNASPTGSGTEEPTSQAETDPDLLDSFFGGEA